MTRIDPPIWVDTPKGCGLAHFVIDYGVEMSLHWVVAIHDTGEVWCFTNEDIKFCKNYTLNRRTEWPPLNTSSENQSQSVPVSEVGQELPAGNAVLSTSTSVAPGNPIVVRDGLNKIKGCKCGDTGWFTQNWPNQFGGMSQHKFSCYQCNPDGKEFSSSDPKAK